MSDRAFLRTMRATVAVLAGVVAWMALASSRSIYELVDESSKVIIVSAFVPLVAGLFWRRANGAGALAAIAAGLGSWLALEAFAPQGLLPPALGGLAASMGGMAAGSLAFPGRAKAA
jgi:Na+/proline symporter